jgi:hypothetical protein
MFIWALCFQVMFNKLSSCSIRITTIQNIQQNIRTINNLIKLFPNSLRLTFREKNVLLFMFKVMSILFMQIRIFYGIVFVIDFVSFHQQFSKVRSSDVGLLSSGGSTKCILERFNLQ